MSVTLKVGASLVSSDFSLVWERLFLRIIGGGVMFVAKTLVADGVDAEGFDDSGTGAMILFARAGAFAAFAFA
jgi:hypothetical protein